MKFCPLPELWFIGQSYQSHLRVLKFTFVGTSGGGIGYQSHLRVLKFLTIRFSAGSAEGINRTFGY
ncbi:hypothetical protein BN8_05928 [Fibrisoma limi BUZ 3]|uniref:Uncharacterized protein n=1 Tax=Fibrisoma limi BUZ 3 TaxID=1185876 RepID=I2GRP1_9BACT|nr:hypothetical protein BN8_05928 [Fibrisoma limi BUZ 3]